MVATPLITGNYIATKMSTCHDSTAVVACGNFCSNHSNKTWLRVQWNLKLGQKNAQWNILQSGGRVDPQQSSDPVQYTLNVAHHGSQVVWLHSIDWLSYLGYTLGYIQCHGAIITWSMFPKNTNKWVSEWVSLAAFLSQQPNTHNIHPIAPPWGRGMGTNFLDQNLIDVLAQSLQNSIQYHVAFNSSPPSDAYMRQWAGSTLVQVMAYWLVGSKPLPEPTLPFSQLDPKGTNFSEIKIKIQNFSFMEMCLLKMSSAKWRPFCPGGDELKWNMDKTR